MCIILRAYVTTFAAATASTFVLRRRRCLLPPFLREERKEKYIPVCIHVGVSISRTYVNHWYRLDFVSSPTVPASYLAPRTAKIIIFIYM